jgi:mono/diheme cytochrome c family protein
MDTAVVAQLWPERQQPSISHALGCLPGDYWFRFHGQPVFWGAQVKAVAAALSACCLLLAVSVVLAQSPSSGKPRAAAPQEYDRTVYAELQKAPEKARLRANPLQNDPDAVAAGGLLFEQHCAECHGDAARGGKKGPSLRAAEVQAATPGAVFWILTNGVVRKGMPVWSKLPEPQRWQLVRFIKSLGEPAPAAESPASKP